MRKHLWAVSETLVPRKHVFDFNQALMDLGATVCVARKPKCEIVSNDELVQLVSLGVNGSDVARPVCPKTLRLLSFRPRNAHASVTSSRL